MSVLGSKHKTCLNFFFFFKVKIDEKVSLVHCTTNYDDDNFAFVVSGPACWGDSQWQTLLADCHALCSHDPRDDDDHLVAAQDDDHDNDHVGGDPAHDRGGADTKTETSSKNQNWFLFDWDTRNTSKPATIFMQKAERIYFSCTFIQKVKGESQSERKILYAFLLKVVAGMTVFFAS